MSFKSKDKDDVKPDVKPTEYPQPYRSGDGQPGFTPDETNLKAAELDHGTKQGTPGDGLARAFKPEEQRGPHGKVPQVDKNKLPAQDTHTKYDGNHNDAGQHLANVLPHPAHPDGRSLETAMPPKPFVSSGEMQHIDDTPVHYTEPQRLTRIEAKLRELCTKAGIVYDQDEKERNEREEKRLAEAKNDPRTREDLKWATNVPATTDREQERVMSRDLSDEQKRMNRGAYQQPDATR